MGALASLTVLAALAGCKGKPKTYETRMDLLQVQRLGQDETNPSVIDLEMRFADCPGDARKLVRGDKAFASCIAGVKAGDKLEATVVHAWNAERGNYRSDITKLGACPLAIDPKDEANYEMTQVCTDLKATGLPVGVRCDRTRPDELLTKCPWLRRK